MKAKTGWIAIFIITLIPLILWSFVVPLQYKFADQVSVFTSLGQIFGLTGITLYSLSLILSARFEFLEDFFGGMNRMYIIHHIIGGLSFFLLLIHPLLLSGAYAVNSLKSAAVFLLPGSDWTINLGMISLYLTMVLLILTFFIRLPYQIWRFTHKFLGAVFLVGGLHGLLVSSDISRNQPLRIFMITVMSSGFLGYFYRTILGIFLIPGREYTLVGVNKLNDKIVELNMTPAELPIKYRAGQFVFIRFFESKVDRDPHPFSLTSPSNSQNLRLAIKSLGDLTGELPTLRVGSRVKVEGPYGRFVSDEYKNKDQIWIAGGIGLTPFLSMARSINGLTSNIWLFYVVRDESEAVFIDELNSLAQKIQGFNFGLYSTAKFGHITAQIIKDEIGDLANKEIFLCGPPPMMSGLKSQFHQIGVAKSKLHSEEFALQ